MPTVISRGKDFMSNWSKNRILWLIGGLLWVGMAFAGPLAPILEIPFPIYNFGEVEEGTIISHDYLIKNTGKGILEIKEVQPGWGCSVAHYDEAIPPGGEGKVTLTINLKGVEGPVWKIATIFSNDPQKPTVSLNLQGTVRPSIE